MGERILLVDDSPDVTRVCAQILSDEGFEVDVAYRGRQALSMLKEKGDYDVLIVDFALPDISGLDLLHSLEKDIPAILISGYLSKSEMNTISRLEDLAVLRKPFPITALVSAVKRVLREQKPR
ncbi:MAG: response regulator [Anaerolineae bacterium]|nr:response regulator [Anaerolineae bacterium]